MIIGSAETQYVRPPRSGSSRRRAVALLLVLIAVAVAGTIAYSYLGSQGGSLGIARNIRDHAAARCIADTGLDLAVADMKRTSNWRTAKPNGNWVNGQPLLDGTCTIYGEDGLDTNGDGTISASEGDGNLADDPSDPLTLIVTGQVNHATAVVRAVVRTDSSDPTEFGNPAVGPSQAENVKDVMVATQVVWPTDGKVTQISIYTGGPAPKNVRLAIYGDVAGEPGALLTQTNAVSAGGSGHWAILDVLTPVDLNAGTYWLAFSFEHRNQYYSYAPTGGRTRIKNFDAEQHGYPANWGASNSSNTFQISIKASCPSSSLIVERY